MFLQIKWSGLFEPAPGSRCDVGVGSGVGGGEHGYSCKLVRQYTSHIKKLLLTFQNSKQINQKRQIAHFFITCLTCALSIVSRVTGLDGSPRRNKRVL
jgi:hypothetical protein